ncbi:MAG TPA: GntR family transcriptional regulator [Gemmataceae bacterium]|nr:GntR family transcriptional regulator [Gemmataceae bacterium]
MKIDPSSHVPIYLQIVGEIRAAIDAGVFRPGEMLPSLRVLAADLRVNPNTVQRAYDELEREGIVLPRRGVGLFVADRDTRSARGEAEKTVLAAFQRGVQVGQDAGLPPERIRAVFDQALDQALRKGRTRS